MGAQSLLKSNTALGAFGRKLRAGKGASQAIVALAHKLACIVYHMLKNKESYRRASAADYDKANLDRERKSIERRAAKLGLKLTTI